jgi:hypothetical protein
MEISALPGTGIKRSTISAATCVDQHWSPSTPFSTPPRIDNHVPAPTPLSSRHALPLTHRNPVATYHCRPAQRRRAYSPLLQSLLRVRACCAETPVPNLPGSLDHGRRTRHARQGHKAVNLPFSTFPPPLCPRLPAQDPPTPRTVAFRGNIRRAPCAKRPRPQTSTSSAVPRFDHAPAATRTRGYCSDGQRASCVIHAPAVSRAIPCQRDIFVAKTRFDIVRATPYCSPA